MPANMLDTWRPSECPTHGQVHAIWLDGHYGRWSAYHERTRYTCVRFDAAGERRTHRFVLSQTARRPTEQLPEVPHTSDDSTFSVPEIARLLIAIGEGRPLRDCAHELRDGAYRRQCAPNPRRARAKLEHKPGALPHAPLAELPTAPVRPSKSVVEAGASGSRVPREGYNYSAPKTRRRVEASRSASIAMDYVDQYAPAILRAVAPTAWPVYLALGSEPIGRKKRRTDTGTGNGAAGEILIAADCEVPGRGYAFHSRFGGGRDKDSWIDFFRSLSGVPIWIVADLDRRLAEAVADFWPETILFACEVHMRNGLRDAAREDRLPETSAEHGPVFDEIRRAFGGLAGWQELVDAVEAVPPAHSPRLRRWLDDHEALVLSQFFLKKQFPRAPFHCEAVGPAVAAVREQLAPYAGAMRNLWRVNLRLALMSAHWSGLDREIEYIADLNKHFSAPAGSARAGRKVMRPDWASGRDFGGARSIDDFLAAAEARRKAAENGWSSEVGTAAFSPNLVARNAARVAVGLPPILTGPGASIEAPVRADLERYPDLSGESHPLPAAGDGEWLRKPAARPQPHPSSRARPPKSASSPPSRAHGPDRRRVERAARVP